MSAEIIPFDFEEQAVRVVMKDDAPWFVAADACRVLGIENHRNVVARLDDDEKGVHTMDTLGGSQQMTIISESGLYALIFTSRKDEARRFRKWVTAEVLPAIRATGRFLAQDDDDDGRPLAFPPGSEMVTGIASCTARDMLAWLDLIREARRIGGRPAGLRMWAQSPLPPLEPGNLSPGLTPADGRACLTHMLAVQVDGQSVADLIAANDYDALSHLALRLLDTGLFVGNGDTPGTRRLFAGTDWAGGAHRAALLALPGARTCGNRTLAYRSMRGIVVPMSAVEACDA